MSIFHLAFPVKDIAQTVDFYQDTLGMEINLIEEQRCIINFCKHQLVAHLCPEQTDDQVSMYPRHFGLIFDAESDFDELLNNAKSKQAKFFQEEFTRFEDSPRAHRSFFLQDPSNNLIEFKYYKNPEVVMKQS